MIRLKICVGVKIKVAQHGCHIIRRGQAIRVMDGKPISGAGSIGERVSRRLCKCASDSENIPV